jgi:hypothetical protein
MKIVHLPHSKESENRKPIPTRRCNIFHGRYYSYSHSIISSICMVLLLSSVIVVSKSADAVPPTSSSTNSSPSVLFSSDFSKASSPPPSSSNISTSSQPQPNANDDRGLFCSGTTATRIPAGSLSNSSFVCSTSTSLKNITVTKTRSISSTTLKNITEGPVKFVFVNSYWTDNIPPGAVDAGLSSERTAAQPLPAVKRQEVGPGEGASILAVVLTYKGFADITGVTGSLELPSGFQDIISPVNNNNNNGGSDGNSNSLNGESNIVLSSYNRSVKAGQTFVLYFPINVLSSAQVGKEYSGSLKLHFFKLEQEKKSNSKSRTFSKVIPINEEKTTSSVIASNNNNASLLLKSINGVNGSKTLNKSKSQTTNKLTPFESTSRTIIVPFKISGKVILDVVVFQEQQSSNNTNIQQSSLTSPSTSSSINVVNAAPGSSTRLLLNVRNEGSAKANGVIADIFGRNQVATNNNIISPAASGNVSISSNVVQQNTIIPLIILGSTTFNVGSIGNGQSKKIDTAIFPSIAVGGTLETLTIRLTYNDAYGNKKTADKIVGVQILPSNPQSPLSVSPSVQR